ncbi:uncharacterized protein JCM6883_001667 [Sporobolomyces salmoneus]|uniref:uncharacterized protein n=1 Tax=Sporobolomyces salmoneus TaxID=183962 RepID=UPI003171BCA6
MSSWIAILLSIASVLLVTSLFAVSTHSATAPKLQDSTRSTTRLYSSPGLVIASSVDHLDLDGLNVLPVTHLPPLKLYIPIPFTESALRCSLEISSSEMAFSRLRVATSSFKAKDTNREPLEVKASGLEVKMKGNTGMRFRIKVGAKRGHEGADTGKKQKEWSWRTSGRTEVELHDAFLHLKLQLTKSSTDSPRLSVLSTTLAPGVIDSLQLKGFHPFGKLVTFVIPYIRSTFLVSYPVGIMGDYLIREAVEGRPVDELLAKFAHFASKHVDSELYGGIVDDEREQELSTPLDSNSLVPPSLSSDASSPSSSDPSPSIDRKAPSPSPSSISTPFRFHAHLRGPTRLHSFRLPDFAPELYRSDGKGLRNTLQSLNLLTSEFKLLISKSSLESISFESASVAFDPPANSPGIRGGELVITVSPLSCTLVSSFSLTADVKNPLLSWASGMDKLGEKGTSTTTVHSKTLQIRLKLSKARAGREGAPIVLGVEEDVAALGVKGGKDSGKALSISDFTSIESRVELGSKLGKKLGEKVVNKLLEGLKTQLAQAASLIIAHFLVDLARDRLQQVLDQVDNKLRVEGGVEWGKVEDQVLESSKSEPDVVSSRSKEEL